MNTLKKIGRLLFNKIFFQKIIAYTLLILAFYLLQDFFVVLFLTFIFAYLFLTLGKFLKLKFDFFLQKIFKNKKTIKFFKRFFSLNIIIIFLYLTFVGVLFFSLSDLLPKITRELKELPQFIPALSEPILMIASKLEEIKNINSQIGGSINEVFSKQDIDILLGLFEKLKTFGAIFLKVILSLVLSYIFIIDRDKLSLYLNGVRDSNFGFLYYEYKIIVQKIVKTFGLVFKAQSMIAFTNAILTTVGLIIIGWIHYSNFPFVYTLAIVVFICGFIPILGTFISSFPILLIGYTTFGTWTIIAEIVFLIGFIHALEAYYLNPKIVSSFIHIPISLTFLILILSEHLMGFAGLVIGISSFYLIMELFRDADEIITKSKKALLQMNDLEENTKKSIKKDVRVSRKVD